jgi:NAD+ synthase
MTKNDLLIKEITDFITEKKDLLNRHAAVLGLSGGLDSAVAAALAVKSLGREKVILINLPERDSNPVHQSHAKQFAEFLGCKFIKHSLTLPLMALGTYGLLPISFLPTRSMRKKLIEYGRTKFVKKGLQDLLLTRFTMRDDSWEARATAYALAKHRMRMVWIYQYAERHNSMVIGAANKTEWMTGTFSKWGIDHCADIMPIMHLFRTQVEEIAEELAIPDTIRMKNADPDILPGLADKNVLLGDFRIVDQILKDFEDGKSKNEILKEYDQSLVEKLFELMVRSEHMRLSPYHL